MDWCDTSAIDWDAIGAVGTWVVGGAAAWVAFQANVISRRLKRDQEQRDAIAARAMLSGLRTEAMDYARRLRNLGDTLAQLRLDGNPAKIAQMGFESLTHIGFTDFGHRAEHVKSLPQEVADAVNWLYARERTNRAQFIANVEVFKQFNDPVRPNPLVLPQLKAAAQDLAKAAEKVVDVANRLSRHLGLLEDPR